jgi:O-antigen ligase
MKRESTGYLHWVFPAMLALAALEVLLSGRDLTQALADLEVTAEQVRHPVVAWLQRGVSLMLIAASIERIAHHFMHRKAMPSPVLAWTFLLFWLTTVAAPAVLGANPRITHEYLYPLLLGLAAVLTSPIERDRILDYTRSGLLVFLAAGLALIPLTPTLVLDPSYSQGLLPGIPRMAGLAAHSVGLGMLAQTALLILWARPFSSRWLNRAAWVLGLSVLFLAQSKTAWIAFFIGAACMLVVRRVPDSVGRLGDPRQSSFAVVACMGVIGVVLAALFSLLVVDLPTVIAGFFDTSQGAQLVSMTGRDRIWIVAMEEWERNPVFGWGLGIWDPVYRAAIGMPFATHAHNQFLDTLSRSGSVGAIGLVLYAVVLLVMSVRYARASGGLSLAMFSALALVSISEIPLTMMSYGTEVFTHLLLVVTLAGAARSSQVHAAAVSPVPPRFRTATRAL